MYIFLNFLKLYLYFQWKYFPKIFFSIIYTKTFLIALVKPTRKEILKCRKKQSFNLLLFPVTILNIDWLKVAQSCPSLCNPMDYIVHGILQARILSLLAVFFFFFFLPFEPQGKPKNIGVLSPSLLQQIFLTEKLNLGLLHCRRFFITELSGKPITAYQDIDELPASLLKMHEFKYREISENLQSYSKIFRFMFHLIILEW